MKFTTYENGKPTGEIEATTLNGVLVAESMVALIVAIISAAKKDGVTLTFAYALKSYDTQLAIRKQNVKDKSKATDPDYLRNASPLEFSPETGKPGWSRHQKAKAVDFNVTGKPEVFKWLLMHAFRFGFIRTVASERWHWEFEPDAPSMFVRLSKNDPSWLI